MSFKPQPLWKWFVLIGVMSVVVGLGLLVKIYVPILGQEIRYELNSALQQSKVATNTVPPEVLPPDPSFSIYIPKISALAPVIPDVDPIDSRQYQLKLTQGVAHARGSALPGQSGNVFLFAHSAGNPLEASKYNAVFYLLSKLEQGDRIFLWYQGEKISYQVDETRLVSPKDVQYLSAESEGETLVLMTCWPPGTTLKRLLVLATPQVPQSPLPPEIAQ